MPKTGNWLAPLLVSVAVSAEAAGADESWTGLLAEMCAACHGQTGKSPGSVPDISELDVESMQAFLIGFRDGDIEATVMDRIARALSESDIEVLSRVLTENWQLLHGAPDEENDNQ
ncbi:MAG: hypothetical protein OXL68_14105 [Paracoccaceae bacterium]|nr:hypothetical protein [Paracoccaceae bacterium]